MAIYDRNKGKAGRKPNLWFKYRVKGYAEPIREPAKNSSNRKAAQSEYAEIKRQIKLGTWVHPKLRKSDGLLFEAYARRVHALRTSRGVGKNESPPNRSEGYHIEKHLIPAFGKLRMDELTFTVIRKLFAEVINPGAGNVGRSLRNIHTTLRAILVEAEREAVIAVLPPPLSVRRDELPPPVDKDPSWRKKAKFDRGELPLVLGCREIPTPRLIMYASYFGTGTRFSELTSLRVSDYHREMQPLHCLTVHAAKISRHKVAGQVRHVPVIPELQEWLDWWLDEEYEVLFGNPPRPDDVLFPTVSPRRRNKGLATCSHGEIAWWWREHDLPAAGVRHRRIHDSRRTFISLLRSARARDEIVRKITHWSTADEVLDAYTEWEWDAFCRELQPLKLGFPPPPRAGTVLPFAQAGHTRGHTGSAGQRNL